MKKVTFINFVFMSLVLFSAHLFAQPGQVKLNSPADKASGVSIEPAFSWQSTPTAVYYRLQVATTKSFHADSIVFVDTNLTSTSKNLDLPTQRLENNKQYFWRVKAKDADGKWGIDSVRTFYTTSAVTPSLLYPVGGLTVYTTSVTLSWNSDPYSPGVKYDVFYSKSLSGGQLSSPIPLASDITAITKTFGSLELGTTYYWQVRTKTSTSAIASYSAIDSFKTNNSNIPVIPVASWPLGGATVYSKTPTLYFYLNTLNPGLQFNVYYRKDNPSVGIGSDSTGWHTAMNVTLPVLTPGSHYYWRVRSRLISDTSKVSALSDVVDFIVDPNLSLSAQVPVQGWPVGGATVYTTSVQFSWYLNYYVNGLYYKIKYQEDGSARVDSTDWTRSNYITVPNFNPGSTYYWWVKSSPNPGTLPVGSDWSQPETFSIDPGMEPASIDPILSWPVLGGTVYTTTPTLYWYTLSGATGITYQVQYSTKKDFSDALGAEIHITTDRKYTLTTELTEGSTYYWRVKSKTGIGGTFTNTSGIDSFTVDTPAPVEALQPVISTPYDGAIINSPSPILSWFINGSPSGLKYHLQVSNYPFDENYLIIDTDTISRKSYAASQLTPGATYAWRVLSYEAAHPSNKSVYSDVATFTVSAGASGAFVPLTGSPVRGVTVKTVSPVLTWYLPASGPSSKYEIQYSLNKNMSNPQTIENISSTSKTLSGLTSGSTYYWRVRSFNKDGNPSSYSSVESFTAASVTGVGKNDNSVAPAKFEVAQNYPNPFNPSTTIKVSLPAASMLTVKVYNMLGQEVRTLFNSQAAAGVHSVQWHGEDNSGNVLPSGTYIYRVKAGNNVTTGKMMFLK